MPFGQCPICGEGYHLSIGMPVAEWYRRYWPNVPIGERVPGKCFRCFVNLRPGHRVAVRTVPHGFENGVKIGRQGIVTSVEPDTRAIVVDLDAPGGSSVRFHREELFYVLGQKVDT